MLTIAADVIFAVVALVAAVRLGAEAGSIPPDNSWWRSGAWLAAAQLGAAAALLSYRFAPAIVGIRRFVVGVSAGTLIAMVVSRAAGAATLPMSIVAADTLLLILAGIAWRCGVAVWRLTHARPTEMAPPGMTTVARRRTLVLGASDLLQYRELVRNLVWRDLKLKYRGSTLGFLWSLINPIVMLAVYTVAFTYFMRVNKPAFVLHLLLGLLAWTFFASSAMMSTGSIIDSGGLLKSVYFPRSILPLATVLFNFAQYLLTLVVFLPVVFIYYQIAPATPMVAFPVFLALQVLFTAGVAFTLSAMTAVYRDVRHLTEIALSVLFWLTPIIYSVRDLPGPAQTLVQLSPMSPFVTAYQAIFYDRVWPDPSVLAIALVYAIATPLVGATLFLSLEERFAEQV